MCIRDRTKTCPIPDHQVAVDMLLEALIDEGVLKELTEIDAVGHRIVHGGEYFSDSAVVDEDVVSKVEELCELAPLHLSLIHILYMNKFKLLILKRFIRQKEAQAIIYILIPHNKNM